jgi:hypothetical protein
VPENLSARDIVLENIAARDIVPEKFIGTRFRAV